MNSRTQLQLGVIGASHQAESIIALLTGATRSLAQQDRDTFGANLADAESLVWKLLKAIGETRDENERQRVAEYEAEQSRRLRVFSGHVPALRLVEQEG